jgi:hypothetical protein
LPLEVSTVRVFVFGFVGMLIGSAGARADSYAAAVLPVMAPDLLEPQKRAIDERIRAVAADNGVVLQPSDETAASIDKAKKVGAACNLESLACQAQMGVLLGTKQVIVAHVASDWSGDRLDLRLLDALRGSTLREASARLPKDAALRGRVLDGAALSLLAPKKTGAVTIAAGDGALFLDGVAVEPGKARVEGLAPGVHDVELKVEGQETKKQTVTIASGETASIDLGAKASSNAPPTTAPEAKPDVGLWLVGGGAVLAAAGGIGAGALQGTLEYVAMERPTRGALQITGITLLGATAVGVVAAGAGGVMLATEASP